MKTTTTKTHRPKPNVNSKAFLAYLAGSQCSVPRDAWVDRKAVKANKVQFVVGKGSGITFRV